MINSFWSTTLGLSSPKLCWIFWRVVKENNLAEPNGFEKYSHTLQNFNQFYSILLDQPPKELVFGTKKWLEVQESVVSILIFTRPLLPEGSNLQVEILSVCVSVRHHFNFSNLGPSNHHRIMSDPTYHTSLERGWHQQWQWQWKRDRQRQMQRKRRRQWQRQNT